jgi:hypothetical protein
MSKMKGNLHWKVAVAAIFTLSCLHAFGWNSGSRQALASSAGVSFCQVTDASDLLKRLGERTPADTVGLVVSKREVEPEMLVQARLVNTTQHVARYGSEFKIQRYSSTGWKADSSSPDGPWPRKVGKLSPGRAAGCYRFSVPARQESGRYRFLTSINLGSAKKGRVAEFIVQDSRYPTPSDRG